jgi:membrane protease YdiL (CAAX protease family)
MVIKEIDMKKQMALSSLPPTGTSEPLLQSLIEQHPLGSAIIILIADLIVSVTIGWSAQKLLPQFQPEFVTLIVMSVLVALALSVLGWWKTAGFNLPAEWQEVGLVVVPFLIVIGLPFLKGINTENLGSLGYLVVGYALTGFMEEGLMRGIVLQMLRPLGVTRSVVISSILFALLHITNFLFRNPFIVLAQMLGAFVHGIGLGAVRLRTNTIWFVIVLHGLHDLFLKFTNFPAIPLDVVQVTLIMIYGIYILRTWKITEIREG